MDKEYLKMVLALPGDFFEGWVWQAGDRAISMNDQYKRELIVLTTAPLKMLNSDDKVVLLFPYSIGGTQIEEYIVNLRPIPSQEQLQEMIKNHLMKQDSTVKSYDVINLFCDWFKAHYTRNPDYKEVENDSGVSIWVRYAQYVIYGKSWNGDTWI